jgi:hypothetical protein
MLYAAKDFLKQPAEKITGADIQTPFIDELAAVDWDEKTTEANSLQIHEKTGLRQQMSKRSRHLSDIPSTHHPIRPRSQTLGYSAPIPTYALAPSEPIPIGFVAHARDACIQTDFDWDTSKTWGDGGTWDEEWSTMHRRVGNGLESLIAHYKSEGEQCCVVLVTHQACCNALIRRMSGAPALHDIGAASLTLAVRRAQSGNVQSGSPNGRRSLETGLPQTYEMKIVASTEHLRGGFNPLGLNSPRLGMSPALASRRIVGADSPEGFSLGESIRPQAMNRSFSHRTSEADAEPPSPNGLWKGVPGRQHSVGNALDDIAAAEAGGSTATKASLPVRSSSQKGMWGEAGAITRDRSPGKRRWTAVDRSP